MKEYSKGEQNIITDEYQVIRLSEGCPHKCPWCREWKEIGEVRMKHNEYRPSILYKKGNIEKWNENVEMCSDCGIEWKKIGKSCPVCYSPPENNG